MKRLFFFVLIILLNGCTDFNSNKKHSEQEIPPVVQYIEFITNGRTFTPIITVEDGAEITWSFSDGATSSSENPSVDFGSENQRTQKLLVSPWSAVTMINVGYDAGDGGSTEIPLTGDCHVSQINNLYLVRENLQILCISYNDLTSIDVENFTALHTIESFFGSLVSANVRGCTSLKRICFERNHLDALDLSDCVLIEDLRGTGNNYTRVDWPATAVNMWHMCLMLNSNFTENPPLTYPSLQQIWLSESNISGAITLTQQSLDSVWFEYDQITGMDLTGAVFDSYSPNVYATNNPMTSFTMGSGCASLQSLRLDHCQLTTLDISMLTSIHELRLNNNLLTQSAISAIVNRLNSLSYTDSDAKSLNLHGNTFPATSAISAINTLIGKGWSVSYDLITTTSLSSGTINNSYSETLASTGGTAPYTWTVSADSLPDGLSLNSTTGVISGTPATTGTTTFTIRATDSLGAYDDQEFIIQISI